MSNRSFERKILPAAIQFSKEREYWMTKLSGDLVVSCFPQDYYKTDRNGDKAKGSKIEAAKTRFRLEGELFARLLKISKNSDARLFIILVMGLVLLLHKYTGHEDIIVGAPIDKQTNEGEFINTLLALRNDLSGDMTIKELLFQVRQTIVEACENQNYPLETIPYELNMPVSENDDFPLFDHAILLSNIHNKSYISHLKLNMIFTFRRTDDHLEGEVEYNPLLYNKESIERIIGYFSLLLDKAFDDIDSRVADLEILTEAEKERLLIEINNTKTDYPENTTIHELFEKQVEKHPDNIAVEEADTGRSRSYRELNKAAGQLSTLLKERGVDRGTIAAIMGERRLELVIGILAILKAGAGYLPIDAQNPDQRIQFMLADSGTHIFLSQKHIIDQRTGLFQEFSAGKVIALDDEKIYKGKVASSGTGTRCSDLAYIIYTSGTTGNPKGVMVQHQSLVNYINFAIKNYVKDGAVNFPLYSSIGFDLTLTSLFTPLVTGNTVVVYSGWGKGNLMARIIDDNKVDAVKVTPSHLYLIQDKKIRHTISPQEQSNPSVGCRVKRFIVGGEILESQLARDITNNFNDTVEIYNEYGPTEATVGCMIHKYNPHKDDRRSVPIGVPADNMHIYLLDKNLKPLPPRAIGELYVSGIGIARGYLNHPELTAERFCGKNFLLNPSQFPNTPLPQYPITPLPHYPIYRTGDLARWIANGNVEFLGRIDQQVKIRGFRIEIEEIENQLLQHDGIKNTVVTIKEASGGNVYGGKKEDNFLCAYIVSDRELTTSGLREYLSGKLPDYMVPSFFVKMDVFPLTPNGKVDRKALPEPEMQTENQYTPPRNETEKKLVEIWAELLGIAKENIGIEASFFELGGHSLSGTVLVANIHKVFDKKLLLVDIFRLPTIKQLAIHLQELESELFVPIEPVEKKEYYTLSSAQNRLYFLQQMDLESTAYNISQIVLIQGEIDLKRLEETFNKLIERHESLRASFLILDDIPVQKIHEGVTIKIECDQVEGEMKERDQIHQFIRPFELSTVPLLRVGLIKTGETKHLLIVDMHHIISDGVSHNLLIQNFAAIYKMEKLPGLRLQYKDYSEWQNCESQKQVIRQQKEYWLKEFEGDIPVLTLPTDYERPVVQSFAGSVVRFEIGADETKAINDLAIKENTTLYVVLQAVFHVLLSKISGHQEDIVIGTPVVGRWHADLEKIIGMFVNTLALRNYSQSERNFIDFLQNVNEKTLKAFEMQDYPFEKLVEQVSVDRNIGRNPLFDVMFAWYTMGIPKIGLPGLELKPYEYRELISKFDLTLMAAEVEGTLQFTFEYCTKLFKKETIKRFIRYLKKIVSSILATHDTKISDIEIISEEEKKQILFDFNSTETEYPQDKTIYELFEEQVERKPDNIAVVGALQLHERASLEATGGLAPLSVPISVTYSVLNQKANQLSHLLIERGVQPDTIVGIMVGRSIEMVVGIVGILKAGGAYLPIDPEYPQERIDYMLSDSSTRIVVTSEDFADKKRSVNGQLLMVNEKLLNRRRLNFPLLEANNNLHLEQANLAYIIYTSGSTGRPKGVPVQHGSVVNILLALFKKYPLLKEDTYLLKTTYTFDVSVSELFGWYLGGGRLAILEPGGERDPLTILDWIERIGVTHINFVPSMFGVFLEILDPRKVRQLSNLKYIFLAGEALPPHLVTRFNEFNTGIILENIYGPTENTIYASQYSLLSWQGVGSIPIGKPLNNIRLYILNANHRLQPLGVWGELCIGGEGLARGYLNRQELTAEKFVECVMVTGAGDRVPALRVRRRQRVYKTGDLARWQADGNIEFLGRSDHQVKIRGFRIELGEIETRLLKHEDIKEALVIMDVMNEPRGSSEENENQCICAYYTSEKELAMSQLRAFLSNNLPQYMMPSYFIQIEKIPLTSSGKIDRKALQAYDLNVNRCDQYVAPETEIEKKIADIWKKVIQIDKVGINDNFFDIGGHSFSIIKVNTKLRKLFNKDIPVADMFRYPTISALVEYFSREETGKLSANTKERIEESVNIMDQATDVLFADELQ